MKHIIIIITFITMINIIFLRMALAAVTPTPQTATSDIQKQINILKDKIASKVAELNLVEKRGIIGIVTDVSSSQIAIKDLVGNIHFIDVDELTKFNSSSNKTFGISDVSKNMNVGVLGLYNKESRRILARFVTQMQLPVIITGAVASLDKVNYNISITKNNGDQVTVEVADITKTSSYSDSASGLSKSGFSKIKTSERIYVVGYPDKQNPRQVITERLIVFPNLPINPQIGTYIPAQPITSTASATITP